MIKQLLTKSPFKGVCSCISVVCFFMFVGLLNAQTTNVFPVDGNVGIGTLNPNNKLHVNGSLGIGQFNAPSTSTGMSINYVDGGSGTTTFYQGRWGANIYFERSSAAGNKKQFYFGGNGNHRMDVYDDENEVKVRLTSGGGYSYLAGGGGLGIGTTTPKEMLDVNGNLNMRIGEGFKILGDTQYFGANLDAIIFQMEDSNANNGNTDGGFVFRGHTPTDGVSKEWMVIKNGGNVGIGTTPTTNLHVKNTSSGNITYPLKLQNGSNSTGSGVGISFVTDGSFEGGHIYIHRDSQAGPKHSMRFVVNQKNDLFTIGGDGYIGIGTSTPSEKLQIENGIAKIRNNGSSDRFIWSRTDNTMKAGMAGDGARKLFFLADNSTRMTIDGNTGNVGIGTTDPKEKLSVNGTIHTKEVRVDLDGWSDFVFYDNYKLPSLKEVENHIKEKGHLKDIPSAKEVTENGIFLGDMNAKLLQKIEELTLYTIAQEKKILKLEQDAIKNKQLENRLNKLEALLNK